MSPRRDPPINDDTPEPPITDNPSPDPPATPPGPPTEPVNPRKPTRGELGFIAKINAARGKGAQHGRAHIDVDSHALAYFLQGVNCRIAVFENMMISGPLPTDDQKQYEYFLYLRDELESIRNDTLPE